MKTITNLFATVLIAIMMISQFAIGQTMNNKYKVTKIESDSWQPINKFAPSVQEIQATANVVAVPPLTNVLNGVSFYSINSECNAKEVIVLKLINSNFYPVKVSWQMGATAPVTSVVVPASVDIEGSCPVSRDSNKAKLTVNSPLGLDKEDIIKYALSHVTVTEVK